MAFDMTPYYNAAKEIQAFWLSVGLSPANALGLLAQADAESSLNPKAIGDNGKAFGLHQLHMDRVLVVRDGDKYHPGCGIDISKLPSIADQLQGVWWELQHSEKHALALLRLETNAYGSGAAGCAYERPAKDESD